MAYSYYTNNTCTTGLVAVNTVTVPTSGNVPNSSTATFNNAGTFYWQAVYSGDTNNNGASSPCTATNNEQLTVNMASPTITTALSSGTITAGNTAYDTSNLTGDVGDTGAGTVAYSFYTTNTCSTGLVAVNTVTVPTSGNVPNSSTVTFNSVGTFYWQAVYSGDANNNGASSQCSRFNNEQLTVARATPTLTASGPTTGTIGTAITAGNITSTLAASSGSNASGTITFKVFAQATAPTTCTAGHHGGHGHGQQRQRHLPPRRPATRRRVRATTGGTRPMAATPTTTQRTRPVVRPCPRRRWPSSHRP